MARDPRDFDDYDAPRPRRRVRFEDEYDDYYYERPPQRSGWGIAVAVINLVLGSLLSLAGLFISFVAFVIMASGNRRDRDESLIVFIFAFFGLLLGVGYLLSGFGLLARRNWGRIMTLILGAFNFLLCAAGILGIVAVIADRGGRIAGLIFLFFGVLLNLGYGLFAYMVLLRRRIAEEFH